MVLAKVSDVGYIREIECFSNSKNYEELYETLKMLEKYLFLDTNIATPSYIDSFDELYEDMRERREKVSIEEYVTYYLTHRGFIVINVLV